MRSLALSALLLAAGGVHAQCASSLPAGTTVVAPQPLPGQSLTSSVCIDVPESAQRLTVNLTGATPAQDLDLLVRVGSPFFDPALENLATLSVDELFERAHYRSAGITGEEGVVISRASRFPLRAGTLHLLLINFDTAAAGFSIGSTLGAADDFAPINIRFNSAGTANSPCNISGWNDPTPRQPIRGNAGTTLGQQRRNAMLEAARLVGEQLRPAVPIEVRACWDTLEFSDTGGTLAQAGPRFIVVDDPGRGISFPGLDGRHTLHFTSTAGHQNGVPACRFGGGNCGNPDPDIGATFNLAVDNASDPNRRFDYGIERPTTLVGPSFVAVAMHELTHGLGFVGLVGLGGSSGALGTRAVVFGQAYDDAYGRHARIIDLNPSSEPPREFLRVSDAERAAALTSSAALRFAGPRAVTALNNRLRDNAPPFNLVQLHAPLDVAGAGTYSHLGAQHTSQLMLAVATSPSIRSLGLSQEMLQDMGFDPTPKATPVYPLPREVQYFDIARNGHGIDFRRVAGTVDLYFLGFYSYDSDGNPEWYTSLGRVIDGVFVPQQNAFGDSLLRFDYSPGPPPVSQVDASAGFRGEIRIDFVEAARSPICQVSAASRAPAGELALMTWTLGSQTRQWCMQPAVDTSVPLDLDLSSVWFNPSDAGWGITVQSFRNGDGDGIAVGVYYPDAAGKGRWGLVQAPRYVPGQTFVVRQVQGYCRGPECPTPGQLSFVDIGTLSLDLRPPAEGPSRLTLDVTYPGPGGGRFQRTNVELTPANTPRFRGN